MAIGDATMLGMANRFTVNIHNGKYNLGSWSQIDGLDVKWDIAEYRAGDGGNDRWYFPANTHYSVIKLTRAASTESDQVRGWLDSTSFKWEAQTATIQLHDSAGKPVTHWDLKKVMPVRWSITAFDSGASKVATETLELNHVGFLNDEIKY
jgi:phage tail-like protein